MPCESSLGSKQACKATRNSNLNEEVAHTNVLMKYSESKGTITPSKIIQSNCCNNMQIIQSLEDIPI